MNKLTPFEQQHLQVFAQMQALLLQKKAIEEAETNLKEQLQKAMKEFGITSIDNDLVKITFVHESVSTTVDTKEVKKQEPDLWESLLKDYPKTTTRAEHIRIQVK